jgi:hypothetical protein
MVQMITLPTSARTQVAAADFQLYYSEEYLVRGR